MPKHVVVIGVGLAGSACVSALDTLAKSADITVTVVDVRTQSISKYAGCRAAALGKSYAHRVTIPNSAILSPSNGQVINKLVTSIDEKNNQLGFEDGTTLSWDILICASGARNVSPCEPPLTARSYIDQIGFYENISRQIKSAQHVTVLGSGAVGTELAGEIKSLYGGNKRVAILSPGPVLVDGCRHPPPKKFYNRVEKTALKMGMELYLDQRPINIKLQDFKGRSYLPGRREVKTDNGTKFETDLILLCTGKRLNNSFYPKHWLNQNGTLPVRPTLQVTFREDVFAIGDINDVDETKQGYYAQKQARVCVRNVEYMVKKKAVTKEYKPQLATNILIPLGKDVGISYVGGIMLGSMITSRIKGKDLFVKDHWSLYKVRKLLIKENNKNWEEIAQRTFSTPRKFVPAAGSSLSMGSSFAMKMIKSRRGSVRKKSTNQGGLRALEDVYERAMSGKINEDEALRSTAKVVLEPSSGGDPFRSNDSSASLQSANSVGTDKRGGTMRNFGSFNGRNLSHPNLNQASNNSLNSPVSGRRRGRNNNTPNTD